MSKRITFQREAETQMYLNDDGEIVLSQPHEECPSCGQSDTRYMAFSQSRAKEIALQILALIAEDEIRAGLSEEES